MKISVIIPVLNEAGIIQKSLLALKQQSPHEVIVVDGGSTDETKMIAIGLADHFLSTSPGRAGQMNEGATMATGDVLLFLHSDTLLPPNGLLMMKHAFLLDPTLAGGRFRVSFNNTSLKYRMISFYTRFPMFSYGDQAFFIRKSVFQKLEGYNCTALFEDVEFYRRLRKIGKTKIMKDSVVTSDRRFERTGFMRQKMINVALSMMVSFGFSPKLLAQKIYPNIR